MHTFDEINEREKSLCTEGSKGKKAEIEWCVGLVRGLWKHGVWGFGDIFLLIWDKIWEKELGYLICLWRGLGHLAREVGGLCVETMTLTLSNDTDWNPQKETVNVIPGQLCPGLRGGQMIWGRFCFPELVHLDGDSANCWGWPEWWPGRPGRLVSSVSCLFKLSMKICLIFEQSKNCHWGNDSPIWGVLIT